MIRILRLQAAFLAGGLSLLISPAFAGSVEVSFVEPARFTDIGPGRVEQERNVEILERHFKQLGAKLPATQTLRIEVIDVDLAGEVWPTQRFNDIRILRGSTDWPRMTLRWSLAADRKALRAGEDRLGDMAYLMHSQRIGASQALYYDLRMVDRWFANRVIADMPQ